jgi:GalNAc-alpha-(1->4)-GalNAc-alpha-(1->3)-diNAcBac-PP-undecaprenol alpha-1,4-N-acetyl-D-galactosaminyltransferase
MEMKKICLVIPSLQAGGMERVMSELATFLFSRNGIELHLILYGRSPEIFYKIPEGIIVHKPSSEFNNSYRFFHSISRLLFLRRAINRLKPYSILSFGEYWNSFVLLALSGCSYPVYISDRCSPAKEFYGIHKLLRKWLYPGARGIIAQTALAKKMYQDQFTHKNVIVVGNPIRFPEQKSKSRKKYVLTVGRLIKSKNHDEIIKVFCHIDKPGWKLIIVGGDALGQNNEEKLKDLIKAFGAESKVEITGYSKDIDRFYLESSIFVFASESEGFPNVIGEAMSAGLPVVSIDCIAGPSEMITDGSNGFLVPLGDYGMLARRLEQLMDNESLRNDMSAKAKKSIGKFNVGVIGKEYYNLLTNL